MERRKREIINTVPFWPRYKRPDLERDKYGPLPNPKI